jgi:hypothetical protein
MSFPLCHDVCSETIRGQGTYKVLQVNEGSSRNRR